MQGPVLHLGCIDWPQDLEGGDQEAAQRREVKVEKQDSAKSYVYTNTSHMYVQIQSVSFEVSSP